MADDLSVLSSSGSSWWFQGGGAHPAVLLPLYTLIVYHICCLLRDCFPDHFPFLVITLPCPLRSLGELSTF